MDLPRSQEQVFNYLVVKRLRPHHPAVSREAHTDRQSLILIFVTIFVFRANGNHFAPQDAISYDILLQRVLTGQLFVLEQLDQLAITRKSRISRCSGRKSFCFLSNVPAQHFESRLDFLSFEHIATGLPVLVRTCDESVSELSLLE